MPGPLEGLLVVDTTWGMPGSIAGMVLCDYGARVVKLERPHSTPPTAAVLRSVVERGKWSLTLDPTDEANAASVDALLDRADVVLDAGPGAPVGRMADSRVGERFPHLVHCHISAYGHDGELHEPPVPHVGRLDRHHLRRSTSVRTPGRRPRAPGSHRRPPIRRRDRAGGSRRTPSPRSSPAASPS